MSAVADAARALIGTRFRAQGRGADGLDCVGLAAAALSAGGYEGSVPRGYALRGGDPARVAVRLDAVLARGDGEAPGDLLLCASGPGQLHLAIRTADGIVHAPWPVLGAWRLV
jgi:cell wall-associated NlpC family hydrolase